MKGRAQAILWGILFILGAAFIVLNSMGYVEDISPIKIAFTIGFAGLIVTSIPYANFFGIFIPLSGIVIMFRKTWGIEFLEIWHIAVIGILLAGGFSLIFHAGRKKKRVYQNNNGNTYQQVENNSYNGPYVEGNSSTIHNEEGTWEQEVVNEDSQGEFNCIQKFGSSIKYIKSNNFKYARICNNFGAMKVYFDGSLIPSGKAVIDLEVAFGGVELYFPANWKVIFEQNNSMGGVSEHHSPSVTPDSPEVLLTGSVNLGGVEIHYI